MSVSLTGGKGENILTGLEAGGGGTGATREARSSGGRAGSERLGTGRSFEHAGGCGGLLVRPGGEEVVAVVFVKKVRLGLMVMGVPNSSKRVGGCVVGWEAEPEASLEWSNECALQATFGFELEERAWKKDGEAVTAGVCGSAVLCFLGEGVGVAL